MLRSRLVSREARVKLGSRSSATLILHDALLYEIRATASLNSGGSSAGSISLSNVTWQSTPLGDLLAPRTRRRCVSATPVTRPPRVRILRDLGLRPNLDAEILRGRRERLRESAHAAA